MCAGLFSGTLMAPSRFEDETGVGVMVRSYLLRRQDWSPVIGEAL